MNAITEVIEEAMTGKEKPPFVSCFLPGTKIQYALDSTSIGYLKTCARLYQYIMLEGWQPRDESVHLRFGQEYHQALHDYEIFKAEGQDHTTAVQSTIHTLLVRMADWDPNPQKKSEELKSKHNLIRTVIWYLDEFIHDTAKTIMLENNDPAMELSFRLELDWGPKAGTVTDDDGNGPQPYLLCGHLDRVVSFSDEIYVMDRKTTTTTPGSYFFNQFEPNNQMSLYSLAGKVVLNSPIRGVIIDAAQIAVGFSRFVRGMTYRTEAQGEEWLKDLQHWTTILEYHAENNYWPQNDTACDKFGGCKFRNVCSKDPGVRERYLEADFIKLPEEERWNPLKTR